MSMYERGPAERTLVVDEWEDGFGWIAHPDEDSRRVSHAVAGDDGVWVFDPIDAPGLDHAIASLGDVAGVAVLSNYHVRDADVFADRYDVPVTVPEWFHRVTDQLDAPIERTSDEIGASGFSLRRVDPLPSWREAVAWRESDRTLYAADVVSTLTLYRVGDERIAPFMLCRLFPPRRVFADVDPERIICGHGAGVFEDAAAALEDGLANARWNLPQALFENGPEQARAIWGAIRD